MTLREVLIFILMTLPIWSGLWAVAFAIFCLTKAIEDDCNNNDDEEQDEAEAWKNS